MIKFNCGECRQSLHVKDEAAGKKVKCPKCGAICTIPAVQPSDPSRVPPAASAAAEAGQPTAPPQKMNQAVSKSTSLTCEKCGFPIP